jgi:hypothetical protein
MCFYLLKRKSRLEPATISQNIFLFAELGFVVAGGGDPRLRSERLRLESHRIIARPGAGIGPGSAPPATTGENGPGLCVGTAEKDRCFSVRIIEHLKT